MPAPSRGAIQRLGRWVKGGVFERVFACLSGEPDFEYTPIDGTIVTSVGPPGFGRSQLSKSPHRVRSFFGHKTFRYAA